MPELHKTCILVSTCDRYRVFADLTAKLIDEYWRDHPSVYFCGADVSERDDWLPLVDDPKDWLSITKHALEDILERGYRQCYLILDDHPPVGLCHSIHLNQTLPDLMDELEAATICLNGWGYWRAGPEGKLLGRKYFRIEQMAENHPWKFQLHPALWNVEALTELLDILLSDVTKARHTPWVFERELGNMGGRLPEHLKRKSYRVNGRKMSVSRGRVLLDVVEKRTFDIVRAVMGKLFGVGMWKRIDSSWGGVYRYYEGPYPLIWSGILTAGSANKDYLTWLRRHRKRTLFPQITAVLDKWPDEG